MLFGKANIETLSQLEIKMYLLQELILVLSVVQKASYCNIGGGLDMRIENPDRKP